MGPVTSIAVGTTKSEVNLLILIAQDRGYFTSRGLEIIHKVYPSGVAAIGGVLEGEVQLATGSEFAFAAQVLAGQDICATAVINRSSLEHLVARVDRGIGSITDLRGKAIGVPLGSRPEFALYRFLYFHGIDLSEVTLVDVPVDQSVQALVGGRVDAVAAWQPHIRQVMDQMGDQARSWSVQEDQPSYTLLMSKAEWAAENQGLITRFLRSLVKAEEFVVGNPEAARSLLHDKLGYDEAYVTDIWPEHSFAISLDKALVVVMEDQARWILRDNLASTEQMPDFLSHVCAESLEEVRPEAVDLVH